MSDHFSKTLREGDIFSIPNESDRGGGVFFPSIYSQQKDGANIHTNIQMGSFWGVVVNFYFVFAFYVTDSTYLETVEAASGSLLLKKDAFSMLSLSPYWAIVESSLKSKDSRKSIPDIYKETKIDNIVCVYTHTHKYTCTSTCLTISHATK